VTTVEAPTPDARHNQIVVRTIAIWIGIHVALLAAFGGWTAYAACAGTSAGAGFLGGCGTAVGLIALAIGWLQLIYGVVLGVILLIVRRTAIAQGVFIACAAVVVLYTVLCFGAAAL
jgi:hypothetical protein